MTDLEKIASLRKMREDLVADIFARVDNLEDKVEGLKLLLLALNNEVKALSATVLDQQREAMEFRGIKNP